MEKPFTIIYEEFKEGLKSLINNSGLPACIIEPILDGCLIEIRTIAKKQYELDKNQYENSDEKIANSNS